MLEKEFVFQYGGKELAQVLLYYGFIENAVQYEQKIVCPFHKDVNPSMKVNLKKGEFFCFGCGIHGDALYFVEMMHPYLNDLEATLKLIKILKSKKANVVKIPERYKEVRQDDNAYDISHDYYYGLSKVDWMLNNSDEVKETRKYMRKRGFDPETLNRCQAKVTYNSSYAIIFPMLDNGQFRGWVCRTTLSDVEKKRKYLYNTGFSKATTLVGDYLSCDCVFVVEGYMDRLKFVQHGVNNVVAILGWKMSREQEQKLKQAGIKYIISALDNDECGRKGTKYLTTRFDHVVRFCYLKGIKDVGETSLEIFKKMYDKTMLKLAEERKKKDGNFRQDQVRSPKTGVKQK